MRRKRSTKESRRAHTMPIKVVEDFQGRPKALALVDGWKTVVSVESTRDESGTVLAAECVVKSHYQLVVSDGYRVRVLKNHITGDWSQQL